MYTKCIPHFDKLLYTFNIQNQKNYGSLILYTKCMQKFVKMWDTICIHTFCIHFAYINSDLKECTS